MKKAAGTPKKLFPDLARQATKRNDLNSFSILLKISRFSVFQSKTLTGGWFFEGDSVNIAYLA